MQFENSDAIAVTDKYGDYCRVKKPTVNTDKRARSHFETALERREKLEVISCAPFEQLLPDHLLVRAGNG